MGSGPLPLGIRRRRVQRLVALSDAGLSGRAGSLGGYYRDRDFFVGLGVHGDSWVLVRPIGRPPEGFLGKLARFVAESGKSPWVYVKKPGLLGGVEPRPWDANAPGDDDTYPEYIVDTRLARKLAEAPGRRGQRLRWQLRQCESLPLVRDSLASAGATAGLRQFLRDHFGNEPGPVSSYENMIEILSSEDSPYWSHHLVRDEHRRVVGFFAYEWVMFNRSGCTPRWPHARSPALVSASCSNSSTTCRESALDGPTSADPKPNRSTSTNGSTPTGVAGETRSSPSTCLDPPGPPLVADALECHLDDPH